MGVLVGLTAGYVGGRVDTILMRLVDVMYAFPALLLIILMMAVFRTTFEGQQAGTLAFTLNRLDASVGGLLFVFIGIGLHSLDGDGASHARSGAFGA